jgi:DNA polymerase-1
MHCPNWRNSRGEPTGAVYGVANMLRKLAQQYKAQARACVFDAKGKTFREAQYPQYKANRNRDARPTSRCRSRR